MRHSTNNSKSPSVSRVLQTVTIALAVALGVLGLFETYADGTATQSGESKRRVSDTALAQTEVDLSGHDSPPEKRHSSRRRRPRKKSSAPQTGTTAQQIPAAPADTVPPAVAATDLSDDPSSESASQQPAEPTSDSQPQSTPASPLPQAPKEPSLLSVELGDESSEPNELLSADDHAPSEDELTESRSPVAEVDAKLSSNGSEDGLDAFGDPPANRLRDSQQPAESEQRAPQTLEVEPVADRQEPQPFQIVEDDDDAVQKQRSEESPAAAVEPQPLLAAPQPAEPESAPESEADSDQRAPAADSRPAAADSQAERGKTDPIVIAEPTAAASQTESAGSTGPKADVPSFTPMDAYELDSAQQTIWLFSLLGISSKTEPNLAGSEATDEAAPPPITVATSEHVESAPRELPFEQPTREPAPLAEVLEAGNTGVAQSQATRGSSFVPAGPVVEPGSPELAAEATENNARPAQGYADPGLGPFGQANETPAIPLRDKEGGPADSVADISRAPIKNALRSQPKSQPLTTNSHDTELAAPAGDPLDIVAPQVADLRPRQVLPQSAPKSPAELSKTVTSTLPPTLISLVEPDAIPRGPSEPSERPSKSSPAPAAGTIETRPVPLSSLRSSAAGLSTGQPPVEFSGQATDPRLRGRAPRALRQEAAFQTAAGATHAIRDQPQPETDNVQRAVVEDVVADTQDVVADTQDVDVVVADTRIPTVRSVLRNKRVVPLVSDTQTGRRQVGRGQIAPDTRAHPDTQTARRQTGDQVIPDTQTSRRQTGRLARIPRPIQHESAMIGAQDRETSLRQDPRSEPRRLMQPPNELAWRVGQSASEVDRTDRGPSVGRISDTFTNRQSSNRQAEAAAAVTGGGSTPDLVTGPEPYAQLRILARSSHSLQTGGKIQNVAVANPLICDAIQFSPTEVAVIAKRAGQSNVTIWFEGRRPQVYRIVVEDSRDRKPETGAEYAKLQKLLDELFPDSLVTLRPDRERLVVMGQAKSRAEAVQIMSVIRSVRLIPVVDRLQLKR